MTFLAGQLLTADDLNPIVPTIKFLTSSVSVASTTAVEITELNTTLAANTDFLVEIALQVIGATVATDDVAISWSVPSGASVNRHALGPAVAMTDSSTTTMRVSAHNPTDSVQYGLPASGSSPVIREQAIVRVSTSSGTVAISAAKVADTGGDISIQVRSWIRVTQILT